MFFSNNHKKVYKVSSCNTNDSFPQMIVIPFFKNATQIIPNCETYPKHKTALALMVFYHHWLKWFGDENFIVKNMLEKVMIEWDTKKRTIKKAYNIRGKEIENPTIVGLVRTNTIIWVWEGYSHKIAESSLIHELVHLSLRAKYGSGDSDHEGNKYDGWTADHSKMILEAKDMLRSFDI